MTERDVRLRIDGRDFTVPAGHSVAATLANLRVPSRRSVRGEARGPLCGMGICFECRVTIDGKPLVRACMVECRDGMEVRTRDG